MNRRGFVGAGLSGLAAATAGCLTGIGGGEADSASRGLRLPSLDVRGSPGGRISIRPPEKVVVLDFFTTWCAPCKPEMANLRAVRSRFDSDRVFVVSVTQETDEAAVERFWTRYEGTWPVVLDPDLTATRKYDVTGIPTILVLTPDGTEVMRHTGLAGEERIVSNVQNALERAGTA